MASAKKAKARPVSTRSRAARREASPSMNLDKSITSVKASKDTNEHYSGAYDAGVSKKTKQKPMTRAQRMRKEKGLERAEANVDIFHTKKAKSFVRAKRIDDRRVNWEALNDKTAKVTQAKTKRGSKAVDEVQDDWTDDETPAARSNIFAMPGDEQDNDDQVDQEVPNTADPVNNDDDDDEIL